MATLSTGHAALLLTSSDDTPCQGPPVATPQLPRNQAACASHHAKASGEGSPLPTPEDAEECWERQGDIQGSPLQAALLSSLSFPRGVTI